MATVFHLQIKSSVQAELAAKNELIKSMEQRIARLQKERDLIKTKWENLKDFVDNLKNKSYGEIAREVTRPEVVDLTLSNKKI